jgi:glycosyltransferase involved in cell wall biosynthesis
MSRILFLTSRMLPGYGVDLAVHNIALQLKRRGHRIAVVCLGSDGSFCGYPIEILPARIDYIRAYARAFKAEVIVAHTSPFYEMLPALKARYRVFAWEYGDPPPELFPDAARRLAVKQFKVPNVYPMLDGVVAISKFIARDCGWLASKIIYCGCDHVPDLGSKGMPPDEPTRRWAPLRVGTLMRLGQGEALYKGNQSFRDLCRCLRDGGLEIECHVMGRGSQTDALEFEREGIHVHLNASDEEKQRYLRDLDIFVSLSTWEGFNLPLVEAQAMGTVGLALNLGAHPEVTPFVFDTLEDVQHFVESCARDRRLLCERGAHAYQYVRSRFRWSEAADEWLAWTGLPSVASDFRESLSPIERAAVIVFQRQVRLRGQLINAFKKINRKFP